MSRRALPFTVSSIARIIKGVEKAGRFVVGVKPDGTLIIGDKPAGNVPAAIDRTDGTLADWSDA